VAVDEEEEAFRHRLLALADFRLWSEWDVARLVFADWLEERGRIPEAALTRAPWRLCDARVRGPCGVIERWRAHTLQSRPAVRHHWHGYVNGAPLLHFPPRTLKLHRDDRAEHLSSLVRFLGPPSHPVYFSFAPGGRSALVVADVDSHPLGFTGLFVARA